MASLKERATAKVDRVRERRPFVDHVFTMLAHYGEVKGNVQAGAVTYFGFLSFFPILALGFFVIGYLANVYPDAEDALTDALKSVLPGMIGDGDGQISLSTFRENAGAIGLIGLAGVLYSGLGWLSGMRDALLIMFKMPPREQPNFFVGKGRDLVVLALVGFTLIVSVALSGAVTGFSAQILEWVGIRDVPGMGALLWVIGHALGIAATTLLFFALFKLLALPHLPRAALVQGAVLGALGFEVLKSLANLLIASTKDQPAFQAFGVALILLVWINYFSRVTMYSAAWAYTSSGAEAQREHEPSPLPVPPLAYQPAGALHSADTENRGHKKLIAGAAAGLAVLGAVALKVRSRRGWERMDG
ncbi:MAG TPA: YihY/virulence factor BrkB family protein [Nocardioidaceae bacterium]|nr:YihY/virulence factor BrkB family protein [Nocardioidaceae bacterium]